MTRALCPGAQLLPLSELARLPSEYPMLRPQHRRSPLEFVRQNDVCNLEHKLRPPEAISRTHSVLSGCLLPSVSPGSAMGNDRGVTLQD